jgi:hypothetical protein
MIDVILVIRTSWPRTQCSVNFTDGDLLNHKLYEPKRSENITDLLVLSHTLSHELTLQTTLFILSAAIPSVSCLNSRIG